MTALRRLALGSSASLASIIVNLLAQILLVPIFLSHWATSDYGLWLALQGANFLLCTVDLCHQDYVGFECLKLPINRHEDRSELLSAALPFVALTGLVQIGAISAAVYSGFAATVFSSDDPSTAPAVSIVLLGYALFWVGFHTYTGVLARVLSSVGEYPRTAWWNMANGLAGALGAAMAVVLGFSIIGAFYFQIGAQALVDAAVYIDFARCLRVHNIKIISADLRLGAKNFIHSIVLIAMGASDVLSQSGFRIILLPFIGAASLAVFSTLRTISNILQQGINSLINPGLPELMRFVAVRDLARTEAMMCFLWLLIVFLFSPLAVILQIVAPFAYSAWTLGKMNFDGISFALLSSAIMVSGLSQPARAIIRGNNLLPIQVTISVLAGVGLIGFTWILAPRLGIHGAALALLGVESIRAFLSLRMAQRWIKQNDLSWPGRYFMIASVLVLATVLTVIVLAQVPERTSRVLLMFVVTYALTLLLFWRELPSELQIRVYRLIPTFLRG
jgi:O-antigen/teichoic acid export membrane protein